MKKASQILLLVGGIYSFVCAWSYFFCGLSFILAGALGGPELVKLLNELGIDFSQYGLTAEQIAEIAVAAGIAAGVCVMLWSGVAVASGVVALLGRKKQNKTFYILNAVFGTLSGAIVNGVGGVMGMFTLPKEEQAE